MNFKEMWKIVIFSLCLLIQILKRKWSHPDHRTDKPMWEDAGQPKFKFHVSVSDLIHPGLEERKGGGMCMHFGGVSLFTWGSYLVESLNVGLWVKLWTTSALAHNSKSLLFMYPCFCSGVSFVLYVASVESVERLFSS